MTTLVPWLVIGGGAFALLMGVGRAIHDPVRIHHKFGLVGERATFQGGTIVWQRTRQGWRAL